MAGKKEKGWWYPWIFIGFMGFVVAVNMALLFFATNTFSGLKTEQAFKKGINYNQALSGAQAQAALGWKIGISFTPEEGTPRRGRLLLNAADREGRALADLTVKAWLIRPTHQGFDTSMELENLGEGGYAATVTPSLPGRWIVRIHAYRGEDGFQMKQEIMVP